MQEATEGWPSGYFNESWPLPNRYGEVARTSYQLARCSIHLQPHHRLTLFRHLLPYRQWFELQHLRMKIIYYKQLFHINILKYHLPSASTSPVCCSHSPACRQPAFHRSPSFPPLQSHSSRDPRSRSTPLPMHNKTKMGIWPLLPPALVQ